MRRSKLESFEDILETLVEEPLSVERIAFETSMSVTVLGKRLDFLLQNGLIEERPSNTEERYAVTERGIAVLKTLNFQKYLARVQDKLMVIDEAMQVIKRHSTDVEEAER